METFTTSFIQMGYMTKRRCQRSPEILEKLMPKRAKAKGKKLYNVPVSWTMVARMGIEADSPEEAADIARDMGTALPDDGEYLSESFEVYEDEIEQEMVSGFSFFDPHCYLVFRMGSSTTEVQSFD
jgi:hypothetical protein